MAAADRTATRAIVKRFAVFISEKSNGKTVYLRRPYDVVEYDYGVGERETFIQPHFGRTQAESGVTRQDEVYDEIRIYDTAPSWDLCSSTV